MEHSSAFPKERQDHTVLCHKVDPWMGSCLPYRASHAMQDVAAGDGTTSVTVICGALLRKCLELLERGVHPTVISDSFAKAVQKAEEILQSVAVPVDLNDRESLIKAANTYAPLSRLSKAQSSLTVAAVASCSSPMQLTAVFLHWH